MMIWDKDAGGRPLPPASETLSPARLRISSSIIQPPPDNPASDEVAWRMDLAAILNERLLTLIVLNLRDIDPKLNTGGYLLREICRLEVRRRRRQGGAS